MLSRPPTDPVQAGEGGGDDTTTGSSSSIGAATPPPPSTQPLDDMSNDDASCAALMASDSTTTLQGSSSSSSMLNSFHSADPGAAATARCAVRESVSVLRAQYWSGSLARLSFQSPSPPLSPERECCFSPLWVQEGRHTRLRGRGWGTKFKRRDRHSGTLCSVADPYPESGAFLTPGSGMG